MENQKKKYLELLDVIIVSKINLYIFSDFLHIRNVKIKKIIGFV